jgi:integrase
MDEDKRVPVHFDDEIFLQDGETYYYRGTPIGLKKRIERSLGVKKGAAQKDVLQAKKNLIESLGKSGTAGGKNSFNVLAKLYEADRIDEAKDPKILSPRTLSETKLYVNKYFIPYFGTKRVNEMEQSDFTDYCRKYRKLNLVNHRKVLNHFMGKWCVQNGYLKYKIEFEIPKFAHKKRRGREVLTPDEIRSILAINDDTTLLYIVLYLLHGMRNMEICKLRWVDVDWEKNGAYINPESNRRRKARAIPLNDFAMNLLTARKASSESDWVFPSRLKKGQKPYMDPTGGIRKRWQKALEAAGIARHITPHDLRATFETYMHTNKKFTDTQREKMAGAQIDVQKEHYVKMQIEQLRGLENSVKVDGLDKVLKTKIREIRGGNTGGKGSKKKAGSRATT